MKKTIFIILLGMSPSILFGNPNIMGDYNHQTHEALLDNQKDSKDPFVDFNLDDIDLSDVEISNDIEFKQGALQKLYYWLIDSGVDLYLTYPNQIFSVSFLLVSVFTIWGVKGVYNKCYYKEQKRKKTE